MIGARRDIARTAFSAVLVAALAGAVALANGQRGSFKDRVDAADLIFDGVVVEIAHADSLPGPNGEPPLPHTFVTFDMRRVFKGQAKKAIITLRFLGGPGPGGKFLRTSSAPTFDLGERAILLVVGNESVNTPLVGQRSGRFRIVGGRVYDDFGRAVGIGDGENVRLGRRRDLDEVRFHMMDGQLVDLFAAPRPPFVDPTAAPDAPDAQVPSAGESAPEAVPEGVTLAAFSAMLDRLVGRKGARGGQAVSDADPVRPFEPAIPRDAVDVERR